MRCNVGRIMPLVLLSGCTVVNTVRLPSRPGETEIFVTAGDIQEPHDILGVVQATRAGVLLFGLVDVVSTDSKPFKDALIQRICAMGGDGAVRARFHMTQYTPLRSTAL